MELLTYLLRTKLTIDQFAERTVKVDPDGVGVSARTVQRYLAGAGGSIRAAELISRASRRRVRLKDLVPERFRPG